MNEAESRRKETKPSTFTTKKVKTLPDEVVASNLEAESASPLKVDYGLAARTALQNVKQELAMKEVKQWVSSELESTELRESFNILCKTTKIEDKEELRKQGERYIWENFRHDDVHYLSRRAPGGQELE